MVKGIYRYKGKISTILSVSLILSQVPIVRTYAMEENSVQGENKSNLYLEEDYIKEEIKLKEKDIIQADSKKEVNNESKSSEIIDIPDINLKRAINEQLGNDIDDVITKSELEMIKDLWISYRGIESLEGIQYCINLKEVDLSGNNISNISALSELTNLELLYLSNNKISNISPLSRLVNLKTLSLGGNDISDISALSELTNLESLRLSNNKINDISALSRLVNLKEVDLSENRISNISALSELTNLESLNLINNKIYDISALSRLVNLKGVDLRENSISNIDSLKNLTNLVSMNLSNNDISNIEPLKNLTNLINIDLSNNDISNIEPLKNLTELYQLFLDYNDISNIEPLKNFTYVQRLGLSNNKISNIEPLKSVKGIESLRLNNNNISNIEELSNLNVFFLDLSNNSISNIEGLNNIYLGQIDLSNNKISKIEPLKNSTELYELNISNNNISNINVLKKLTNLYNLYLSNNEISDISVLSEMGRIDHLDISNNKITDIAPLENINHSPYIDSGDVNLNRNYLNLQDTSTIKVIEKLKSKNYKVTVENQLEPSNAPIIGAKDINIKIGEKFNPLEVVSAIDQEDGDITNKVKVIKNTVNINKVGIYKVTYEVQDSDVNKVTKTINVNVNFEDTSLNYWAYKEIMNFTQNGYISATNNKFRPDEQISRAEFVKIVNKAFGFTKKSPENFSDVNTGDWYYDEVRIAINAGYIDSKQSKFRPNDPITREEAASIITSIKKCKDNNLDKIKSYTDYSKISDWAQSSVEGAIEAGYMGVGSTTFRPKDNITRAEAVVTLSRVIQ